MRCAAPQKVVHGSLKAAGFRVGPSLHESGAAFLHQENGDPLPSMSWPSNYDRLACATMFSLPARLCLWSNHPTGSLLGWLIRIQASAEAPRQPNMACLRNIPLCNPEVYPLVKPYWARPLGSLGHPLGKASFGPAIGLHPAS